MVNAMDPPLSPPRSIDGDEDVVASILSKHSGKPSPESRHVVALLTAIRDVVEGQGLQPTPTALFAATMATLDKQETRGSAEVVAAGCTLLAGVLPHVPPAVLRGKAAQATQLLCDVAEAHSEQAPVPKAVLACLGDCLSSMDRQAWPPAMRPFSLVLRLCTDRRPKVRKRAQAALAQALAAWGNSPVGMQASEAVLKASHSILPGPAAAAQLASKLPSKQGPQAEEAITRAVSDALHWLGALRCCVAYLPGGCLHDTAALLLKLYHLRQPLLTRHASDVLALAAGPTARMGAATLAELLRAVVTQADVLDAGSKDMEGQLSALQVVEVGMLRLQSLDELLAGQVLGPCCAALAPLLAAQHDAVRLAARSGLQRLVNACMTDALVATAVSAQSMPKGQRPRAPAAALSVVASVGGGLSPAYQDAWPLALQVAGDVFRRVGPRGAQLLEGLMHRVGQICAGVYDEGEEDEAGGQQGGDGGVGSHALQSAADTCLGAAIRHVGPAPVLEALPLNLQEALDGNGEARTWLLPLLRDRVSHSHLSYWGETLLPLARALGSRAAQAAAGGPSRAREAVNCRALEAQLWNLLPSFCSWPRDTSEALPRYIKGVGAAFSNRPDLRLPICTALQRLCLQNRQALKEHGVMLGYGELPGVSSHGDDDDEDDDVGHHGLAEVPDYYTQQVAEANVVALRAYSKNWLPLLLNTFLGSDPGQRGPLGVTISAYSAVAGPETSTEVFRAVIKKLAKVVADGQGEEDGGSPLEGGATPTERRCTFMDLALALGPGLDERGVGVLYKATRPALQDKEAALQKKAYKLLAYVCEQRRDFVQAHFPEILAVLLGGTATAHSAAKRYRLRCLRVAILMAGDPGVDLGDAAVLPGAAGEAGAAPLDAGERRKQVAASMVTEVVLAVKEANQKSRLAAYALVCRLADGMEAADPGQGLMALFTMVMGGLVGHSPHMVSAAVMVLARLLYEYAAHLTGCVPRLLPPVLSLLRSRSREVIKAVLGFVKVVIIRLPVEELQPFVGDILEGCLLWAEDSKNRFRAKVRMIVERLAKRCGFDAVAAGMPEAHSKLLTHIRKERSRKERDRAARGGGGSQLDGDDVGMDVDNRSVRSRFTSAAGSRWGHTRIFGDDDSDDGGARGARSLGRASARHARADRTAGSVRTVPASGKQSLLLSDGPNPINLLDASTNRALVRAAAQRGGSRRGTSGDGGGGDGGDLHVDEATGRLVINDEEEAERLRASKRKRGGYDSEDSDMEDLKGITGLDKAWRDTADARSVRYAKSQMSLGRVSQGGRSAGGRSATTARGGRGGGGGRGGRGGRADSGDRFKAKKAGGDVKGNAKVEPYAYWRLDRNLMNRRSTKRSGAKKGLQGIVAAAQSGAAKGAKAKRQRQ